MDSNFEVEYFSGFQKTEFLWYEDIVEIFGVTTNRTFFKINLGLCACVCVWGGGHFVCILGSFLKVSVQNEIFLGGGGKLVLKFLFYFRICLEFLIFNF